MALNLLPPALICQMHCPFDHASPLETSNPTHIARRLSPGALPLMHPKFPGEMRFRIDRRNRTRAKSQSRSMAVTTRSRSAFRAQILPSSCHLVGAPGSYGPGWGPRTATLYDNRFLFTGREPSEWGHREMDGQAREGNGRAERERRSQYAATYRSTYTTAAFNFYEYRARAYNAKLGRSVLNAPAGQFTIFDYTPETPWFHYIRLGPQPFPQPPTY